MSKAMRLVPQRIPTANNKPGRRPTEIWQLGCSFPRVVSLYSEGGYGFISCCCLLLLCYAVTLFTSGSRYVLHYMDSRVCIRMQGNISTQDSCVNFSGGGINTECGSTQTSRIHRIHTRSSVRFPALAYITVILEQPARHDNMQALGSNK